MSIFIQIEPDSRSGLTIHTQSVKAEDFEKALRQVSSKGYGGCERKFGLTKKFFDDFAKTDVFPEGPKFLKFDDEFQFDAEDNTLIAASRVYSNGRSIPFGGDALLKRLAEHIFMQWQESHSDAPGNEEFEETAEDTSGMAVDRNISSMNALLMQLLTTRTMLCCFQYLLRQKLRAYVPVLIGTDDKSKVAAFVNGSLLDPRQLKDHLLEQCVAVDKQICVGNDGISRS